MTRGAVQPSDEDLVAAVLEGNREEFGALVERYQGRLINYLLDRKSTRLNSSHRSLSRMPSSA